MPRSDDSNGFPTGRLRRPHPRHSDAEWARDDTPGSDWRYPDPAERYTQGYDEHDTPPSADPYADEWQSAPAEDHRFEMPGSFQGAQEPDWSEQNDPFDWEAPDPQAEGGWRPAPYPDETPDYGHDSFAGRDPWAAPDDRYEEPRGPRAQEPAARDDRLFRRIDGSVQEPDLSALTERAAPNADPFAEDLTRDPSELRDRFFSRTGEIEDAEPAPQLETPRANIFDFEAHRNDTRQPQLDDPYSWDSYDDQPAMAAPEAEGPAPDDPYAEDYDPYDPYADDPHLYAEDDLDADFLDDEPEAYEEPVQQPRSRRKLMVAGVLVAAVATGGAAAFVYKTYQDGGIGSGDAPTVLADEGPVKSQPSDPGGKEFPDGNKQIYDRLTGGPGEPASDQQANSSDDSDSNTIPGIVTTGAQGPADTLDERIAAALRNSGKPSGETGSAAPSDPNAPRSVRTLTVRPDGSVVPAQAASQTASANQPDNSQTVTTAGIVATTGANASDETASVEPQGEAAASAPDPAPEPESAADATPSAPRPEQAEPRPAETRVASAEPASPSTTQPSTASANPFFVQVAARRDQTSALAAFADLQQKYPNILDGLAPTIKRADLGDKGIWYRLWVGPMDERGNAQDVCAKLKQAGLGGCFVRTE